MSRVTAWLVSCDACNAHAEPALSRYQANWKARKLGWLVRTEEQGGDRCPECKGEDHVPVLMITRGLPGSGKTTWATAWVAGDQERRARVNRDSIRMMLGGVFNGGASEKRAIAARDSLILGLLRRGFDVVCDDTNLVPATVTELRDLARRCGAGFEVFDLTAVPLETCLARNAARKDKAPVPEPWIRSQHARYIAKHAE